MVDELGYEPGSIGLFFSLIALGYILSNLAAPLILKYWTPFVLFFTGFVLFTAAVILFFFTDLSSLLMISAILYGLSLGVWNLLSNSVVTSLSVERRIQNFNLLHVWYGIGTIISPLVFAWLSTRKDPAIPWDTSLGLISLLMPVFLLLLLALGFTGFRRVPGDTISCGTFKGMFGNPLSICFLVFAFLYGGLELGLASWIPGFLIHARDFTPRKAALFLSLFCIFLTAGRIIGFIFVEKIGMLRALKIAVWATLVSVMLAAIPYKAFTVFIPFIGFTIAVIFPTASAVITLVCQESASVILSSTFFLCGCGFFIFPGLISGLAKALEQKIFLVTALILTVFVLITIHYIVKYAKIYNKSID